MFVFVKCLNETSSKTPMCKSENTNRGKTENTMTKGKRKHNDLQNTSYKRKDEQH
jgi:hypothetical protein